MLMIFSLFLVSAFAITSIYYSEQDCNLYDDLDMYDQILQDDAVVKEFLKQYPHTTSYVDGIDESVPLKASIVYTSDDNATKNELWVHVREVSTENENDCFWPIQYIYKFQNDGKITSKQYYSWETSQMLDFMKDLTNSPYAQLRQGVEPQDIRCKNDLILITKHDGTPACVFPETKTKLIERGWAIPS